MQQMIDVAKRKVSSPTKEQTDAAEKASHEILPGLVIGAIMQCGNAKRNGFVCISVRHIECQSKECRHAPYLDMQEWLANTDKLDFFADVLEQTWGKGQKVFVHCYHGIERAPLAVAYALHKKWFGQFDFAFVYAFVRRQRPCALDRSCWMPVQLANSWSTS